MQEYRAMEEQSEQNDSRFLNDLRAALRAYRAAHGLTHEEIGNIAGVSRTAIGNFENGTSVPRGEALEAIVHLVRQPPEVFADDLQSIVDYLRLPGVSVDAKMELLAKRVELLHDTLKSEWSRFYEGSE